MIGAELISRRILDARLILRASWGSAAAGLLTCISALFISLQYTIFLGAGLSLLLYIYASSKSASIRALVRDDQGRYVEQEVPDSYPSMDITILTIGGHEFYAEVPLLQELLPSYTNTQNAVVIFRLRGRENASSTGLEWLIHYHEELQQDGNLLILAGVRPHVMKELERTDVIENIGDNFVFPAQPGIGASLDAALEAGEKLLQAHPSHTIMEVAK